MNAVVRSMVLAMCLMVGAGAGATDDETNAVIKAVESKYSRVEAMQADFVQTKRSETFGEDVQRGDVIIKRPAKMFWNFTTGGQQFVTNGKTMWIYTKEANQVIQISDVSAATSVADSLLQSLGSLHEQFHVKLVRDVPEQLKLELKPKVDNGQLKQLTLVLDKAYVVQSMTFVDAFDNITQLDFSRVRLNSNVPDSTFDFKVPDGVEVIEN